MATSGSGAVIASLRGKVHSLERALKEKEAELSSLKREASATGPASLKEMRYSVKSTTGRLTGELCWGGGRDSCLVSVYSNSLVHMHQHVLVHVLC